MIKLMEIYQQLREADFSNDAGQPFWGNYGAGVLPVCSETGRILVGLRSKDVNEPGTWGNIGGAVEDEDEMDVKGTALTEFNEETGYTGKIVMHPAYIFKMPDNSFTYYNFIGELDQEFTPKDNWETDEFKWLTLDELMELDKKHFGLSKLLDDSRSMNIIKKIVEKSDERSN